MMVSINQRLEADVIELVAGEFGYTVEFIGIDDALEWKKKKLWIRLKIWCPAHRWLRSWDMWIMVKPPCSIIFACQCGGR